LFEERSHLNNIGKQGGIGSAEADAAINYPEDLVMIAHEGVYTE
jgi:hypothetical protein